MSQREAKIVTNDMREDTLTALSPEDDPPLKDQKTPKQMTIHDPIYTPEDIENVYHSEEFNVNQLVQRGRDGLILYSKFFVRLNPGKQGFHYTNATLQTTFTITHGRGWVHIDGNGWGFDTNPKKVVNRPDSPYFPLLEKNQDIQILNNDPDDHVDFDLVFPGKLDIKRVIEEDKLRRKRA